MYGVIRAKRGFLKPIGQWNYEEVITNGTRIKVILNCIVFVDGYIKKASEKSTMDHRYHLGLKLTIGHIGFLGHGDDVKFRNIKMKSLKQKRL